MNRSTAGMRGGLIAATIILGLLPSATQAEPVRITYRDAVRIALEKNNTLRRAENSLILDQTAVSSARMQFFPDLRLGASAARNYGRSFSESEGRILSQTNDAGSVRLSSSLVLFDGFGRYANLKAAILDRRAGEADTERTRQTVVFLVISGYLAVIESEAQVRVAEENLASQRDQEALVGKFVDAGSSPIGDLYQQQATVARAELQLVLARRTLELARMDMMQVLQLDPSGEYRFEAPILPDSIDVGPPRELSDLLGEAFENRTDVQALKDRIGASEQDERVAGSGRWPSLTLSGSYGSSYSSGASDRAFLDQFDERRSGTVGLSLSFPIFDRLATSHAVRRATVATDNARIALDERRVTVAIEVRRALLDEQTARESLSATLAELRAANRALEATQQRYEAGAATLQEVTLSNAVLVQAQSSRIIAAFALLWQRHVRDYYVGVLDPDGALIP